MGGGGFSMGGDDNRAMGRFFHSSRFGFCVGGGGLCLSLMVVRSEEHTSELQSPC